MTSWFRWSFALLTLIVSASGGAYFVMKYGLESADPFAVVNHPLQPLMLHVHVLASPWLLVLIGAALQGHVGAKLGHRGSANRRSGLISIGSFVVMTLSGYLLQVVVSTGSARIIMVAHLASGAIFALAYGTHLALSLTLMRRASRLEAPPALSPESSEF